MTAQQSTDGDFFARCLQAGFDEVLALGGEGRSIPASFVPDPARAQTAVTERE